MGGHLEGTFTLCFLLFQNKNRKKCQVLWPEFRQLPKFREKFQTEKTIEIGGWGGLNASEPQPGSEPRDWREVAVGMATRTKIKRMYRDGASRFGRHGHHGFGHHGHYAIVTSHFGHHGHHSGEFTTQTNFLALRASLLHNKTTFLGASREFTTQKSFLALRASLLHTKNC